MKFSWYPSDTDITACSVSFWWCYLFSIRQWVGPRTFWMLLRFLYRFDIQADTWVPSFFSIRRKNLFFRGLTELFMMLLFNNMNCRVRELRELCRVWRNWQDLHRSCGGRREKIPSAYLPFQSGKNKHSNGESHDLNARITRLHVKLDSYSMFLIVFLCFLTRKSKRFRFKNRCNTCVPPGGADTRLFSSLTEKWCCHATCIETDSGGIVSAIVIVAWKFLNALRTSRISCTDHACPTGLVWTKLLSKFWWDLVTLRFGQGEAWSQP